MAPISIFFIILNWITLTGNFKPAPCVACSKILHQSIKMMNLYRCIMSTAFSVIFQQRADISGKHFFPGHKLFKCSYDAGSYNLRIPPTNKILSLHYWSKITIIFSHRNFDFLKELWYLRGKNKIKFILQWHMVPFSLSKQ